MSYTYTIDDIRSAQALVEKAVKEALAGTPFALKGAKGTYGDKMEIKLVLQKSDPAAQAEIEKAAWNNICYLYDLKPEHYGKTVMHKGVPWTAVGFETRRSKYPLRVKNAEGKMLLLTEEAINRLKTAA